MSMPATALVIDDAESLCAMIVEGLQSEGVQTVGHKDSVCGLAFLLSTPVDLLVLDQRMYPLSGVDILEQIVVHNLAPPATILLSAYFPHGDTEAITERAQALTPHCRVMTKPFHWPDLLAMIQEVWNEAQAARADCG